MFSLFEITNNKGRYMQVDLIQIYKWIWVLGKFPPGQFPRWIITKSSILDVAADLHPPSSFEHLLYWCFQGVEKRSIGNESVKENHPIQSSAETHANLQQSTKFLKRRYKHTGIKNRKKNTILTVKTYSKRLIKRKKHPAYHLQYHAKEELPSSQK